MISFKDYFYYDETSPSCLRWKVNRCGGPGNSTIVVFAGSVAGHLNKAGYWKVTLNGKGYAVHRIIWSIFYGNIPKKLKIDHKNKNSSDNKINNLRKVTQAINCRNSKKRKTNTSGNTGIYFKQQYIAQYWVAFWRENGKTCHKTFKVSEFGFIGAKELAIAYRKSQIERLNRNGAGYTDDHGE